MIKVHFTAQDLSEIRFAFSPLSELIASYFMLLNPARHALYLTWIKQTLPAIKTLPMPYLTALMQPGVGVMGAYFPDFLTPMPTTPHPDFETEFQALLATPDAMLQDNVRHMFERYPSGLNTAILNQFIEQPHQALLHLASEIRAYWERIFAPHWLRIHAVLEGDVLYRARQLALHGPETLFGEIHPMAVYHDGCLTLNMLHEDEVYLNGEGVLLVPLVMAGIKELMFQPGRQRLMLSYSARGAGLWDMQVAEPNEALTLMLGKSKAQLLMHLQTPCNNGELAQRLHVTPSAITQHLQQMHSAGLVEFHQNSRWVFYRLTARGEKLLALFASPV
jgi:DNA-binding HxlR family transcriptional regulator